MTAATARDGTAAGSSIEAALAAARSLERGGQWRHARTAYQRLLTDRSIPPDVRAATMRAVARTYVQEGQPETAREAFQAALDLSARAGDMRGRAHAVNGLAIAAQQMGALDESEALYLEARAIAAAADDEQLVAMIDQNLGTVANIRGDLGAARAAYHASLRRYQRLGLPELQAQVLNNLGMLYTDLEDWDAAETAYEAAARACAGQDDVLLRRIEVNQAELWAARRELAKARSRCDDLLRRAGHAAEEAWLGEVHKHYGVVCREGGEYAEAEQHLTRAARTADASRDVLLAAETAREQAELYWRQGRHADTLHALNRAHTWFSRLRAERDLAAIDRRNARLEDRFLEIASRWGDSIESKDMYTQGHCVRVADVACRLAERAGFDAQTLFWFRIGALLHDVGKIVVPSDVLNKPGKLSEDEWRVMTRHPEAGVALLADIDFAWDIRPMVRNHHERWDGRGYPDGLAGEAIPLAARLLCLADVYDALTSTRPYRDGFSHQKTVTIMTEMLHEGHFDPALFALFLEWAASADARAKSL